jgi:hypothetical protein
MRNDNVKLNKNNYNRYKKQNGNETKKKTMQLVIMMSVRRACCVFCLVEDLYVLTIKLAILIRKIIGTKLELTMTITIIMMIPDVDHNNFDNHHECKESNDAGS